MHLQFSSLKTLNSFLNHILFSEDKASSRRKFSVSYVKIIIIPHWIHQNHIHTKWTTWTHWPAPLIYWKKLTVSILFSTIVNWKIEFDLELRCLLKWIYFQFRFIHFYSMIFIQLQCQSNHWLICFFLFYVLALPRRFSSVAKKICFSGTNEKYRKS